LSKYSDNLDYALIAYNWGLGNTDKWIKAGADKSNIPKETRDYLVKVSKELKG
jgi:soluble lytic murein transglycosylase-like protein